MTMMREQEHLGCFTEFGKQRERSRSAVIIEMNEKIVGDEGHWFG